MLLTCMENWAPKHTYLLTRIPTNRITDQCVRSHHMISKNTRLAPLPGNEAGLEGLRAEKTDIRLFSKRRIPSYISESTYRAKKNKHAYITGQKDRYNNISSLLLLLLIRWCSSSTNTIIIIITCHCRRIFVPSGIVKN